MKLRARKMWNLLWILRGVYVEQVWDSARLCSEKIKLASSGESCFRMILKLLGMERAEFGGG